MDVDAWDVQNGRVRISLLTFPTEDGYLRKLSVFDRATECLAAIYLNTDDRRRLIAALDKAAPEEATP